MLTRACLQAMMEGPEIVDLLQENQEEKEYLAEYTIKRSPLFTPSASPTYSPLFHGTVDRYHRFLVEGDDSRAHRRVPGLKTMWNTGDLKPKLKGWNRDVGRIAHWQVRIVPLPETIVDHSAVSSQRSDSCTPSGYEGAGLRPLDSQDRMQTNATLILVETIRAEATEVIQVIQHTTIQTLARSLSIYPQVEPDGLTSLTTRVCRCLLVYCTIYPRH